MPEQPLLRTPMRMPAVGLLRPSISAFTRSAAAGVTDITCGRGRRTLGVVAGAAGAAGLGVSVVVLITLSLCYSAAAALVSSAAGAVLGSSFLASLAR